MCSRRSRQDRVVETARRMRPPVMAEVPAREGGRWRRPGVVGRDCGFANWRAFLRTLDESREQNVFGGTESGYTALCADKTEKRGHDGSLRLLPASWRWGAGRPMRIAPPGGLARDRVRVLLEGPANLTGHVVSGEAQNEARDDGRGAPGRCDRPEILSQPLENMDSAPGIAAPPTGGRGYPCGSGRLAGRVVAGDARNEARDNGRRPPERRGRPEYCSQPLENMDSAPGNAAPPTGGRGYPCGSGRLAGRVVSGEARQRGPTRRSRAAGRRGRPENCSQPLENMDSAPGIAAPPTGGRGYPCGSGRLAGRVVCGDARNEARGNGRRPPGRRGHPENCSQPLENMDSAPGNAAPPTGGRGYPCGSGRLAGRVVCGEARNEARQDGRGPPGRRGRP